MRRRTFLAGGIGALCTPVVLAQRTYRVGMLLFSRKDDAQLERVLVERLAAAEFVEGRNLRIDRESMEMRTASAQEVARPHVRPRPDVNNAVCEPSVDALRAETNVIPIVFVSVTDPVGRGYARTLSRPGSNLSGITDRYVETGVKRLELLREIAPRAKRVAFVAYYDDPLGIDAWRAAASRLGLQVVDVDLGRKGYTMQRSLDEALAHDVDCLLPIGRIQGSDGDDADPLLTFIRFAERHRLPAVFSSTGVVKKLGGLISLDLDNGEVTRRGADMVVRVLRGDRIADLAVQEPDRFRIAVNLRAAKAQGVAFPQGVLLRADEIVK